RSPQGAVRQDAGGVGGAEGTGHRPDQPPGAVTYGGRDRQAGYGHRKSPRDTVNKKIKQVDIYAWRAPMNANSNQEIVSDGLQSVSATARFLGVSRSLVYKLIHQGDLPSVKLGSSRRVPIKAVLDLASERLIINPPNEKAADGGRRPSS